MDTPRRYPELAFTCEQLPAIAADQRQGWCEHCDKHVHNLSAMSAEEQDRLVQAEPDACVSYRRIIPVAVAVVLAASIGIEPASAQDSFDEDATELTTVTVTGGGMRGSPAQALFRESALAEPDIAAATDTQPADASERP